MSFVTLNDVHKSYKMGEVTITASDGISFEIEKGEFALIVGASGAGKTTVLNMLGGIAALRGFSYTTRANISHEKTEQIRARIVCTPAESAGRA